MGARRSGAQSVDRALTVLRCFEAAPGGLGVTELSHRTGLSISTTHRLVRSLVAGELLVQDPRTDAYHLGPLLTVLGRRAEEQLGYGRCVPVLEELAATTGESVNLGIRAGTEVLVVLDVPSSRPLRFDQQPGTRVPIHTSAMGKCLLAFAADPAGEVAELPSLAGVTPRTITDREALRSALERTRAQGWALNDEERHPGVRAVAMPVLDVDGRGRAAIAVQGPTVRLPDERLAELVEQLRDASASVAGLLVP